MTQYLYWCSAWEGFCFIVHYCSPKCHILFFHISVIFVYFLCFRFTFNIVSAFYFLIIHKNLLKRSFSNTTNVMHGLISCCLCAELPWLTETLWMSVSCLFLVLNCVSDDLVFVSLLDALLAWQVPAIELATTVNYH